MLSKLDDLHVALTKLHKQGFNEDEFLRLLDNFQGSLRISLCRILQKDEINFQSGHLRRICYFLIKSSDGKLATEVFPITKRISEKELQNLFYDLLIGGEAMQSFALSIMVKYQFKKFAVEFFKLWRLSSDKLKKEMIQAFKTLNLRGADVFLARRLNSGESIETQNEILSFFLSAKFKNRKNVFNKFLNSPDANQRALALRGVIKFGNTFNKLKLNRRLAVEKDPQILRILLDFLCDYMGDRLAKYLIQKYHTEQDPALKNLYQYAFRKLGEESVSDYCLDIINSDSNTDDKVFAIQELACIQKSKVTKKLIQLMNDTSEKDVIRTTAIEALCFHPQPQVAEALEKFIVTTDNPVLSYSASHSLSFLWHPDDLSSCHKILMLDEKQFPLELSAALDFIRKKVEARKIKHLAPEILDRLLSFCASEDNDIRYPALSAICHVQGLPIHEILKLYEDEKHEDTMEIIAECLGCNIEHNRDALNEWLTDLKPEFFSKALKMFLHAVGPDDLKTQLFIETVNICAQNPNLIEEAREPVAELTKLSSTRTMISSSLCEKSVEMDSLIELCQHLSVNHQEQILSEYLELNLGSVKKIDSLKNLLSTLKLLNCRQAQKCISRLFLMFPEQKQLFRELL
ncbi:MAG: HEAT repeat domain-containing protein [Lentisphaeraceae bacterium]|nr:HEAT repeat domain-containing protein [Lentisphaeraceae bacterium]